MIDTTNMGNCAVRKQAAADLAGAAYDRVPTSESWGAEYYEFRPISEGGGLGGFLWFDTRDELLDFVSHHLLLISKATSDFSLEEEKLAVLEICEKVRLDESLWDVGMEALNEALKGILYFRWWGGYSDLLEGDRDFEKAIRRWAREKARGVRPGGASPISKDEVDWFASEIVDFGWMLVGFSSYEEAQIHEKAPVQQYENSRL